MWKGLRCRAIGSPAPYILTRLEAEKRSAHVVRAEACEEVVVRGTVGARVSVYGQLLLLACKR